MGFLASRTDQTVRVYWTLDPALKRPKKAEGDEDDGEGRIIRAEDAGSRVKRSGAAPDEFKVRPLSNREFLGLGSFASNASGVAFAAVEMCCMAIVRIIKSDGTAIDDEDQIRDLIDNGSPPEFVSAMSQFIVQLTTGGGQKKT